MNSDDVVKTFDVPKYAHLIQLSSDVSNLDYVTAADYDYPVSEGVYAINADRVHEYGIAGDNVKVAVLDLLFDPENPKISKEN